MKTVTFTEFRQHVAVYLNAVEQGETFRILRHGKPVADLTPIKTSNSVPSWKRYIEPITLKGISVSDMIVKERDGHGR
jgi:prevent-host-death family protein